MTSYYNNEHEKFQQINDKTAVRLVGNTGQSGSLTTFVEDTKDRFEANSNGDTAERVKVVNS